MLIPIDEVVHFDVVTHAAASGVSTNADSSGTFNVFEEATDTAILSAQALVLRAGQTGVYRGTFTASAANGFEAGKWYSVVASSTVATIAGKCVAMGFRVAPAESAAGVPKGDVSHWLGTAAATPTVAGVPEVDVTHWRGDAVPATADAGVPKADVHYLRGSATGAIGLTALSGGYIGLCTAAAGTLSTTQMTSDASGFGDDFFNHRWLVFFVSPATIEGWVAVVTDYVSATGLFTFAPAAPSIVVAGDTFILWPIAPSGLAIGDRTGNLSGSVGSVTGAVGSVTGAVGSVTGNVGGNVTGSVGTLAAAAAAQVNAEVLDVLNVDTFAQTGQEAPAATQTIRKMLGFLYKAWRNKSTQDATDYKLFNDDAATVDQKATVSDSGTVFTRDEIGTGP